MKKRNAKNYRRRSGQSGQGMTEYIKVVAAIAVSAITVYSQFSGVHRNQVAGAARALAGLDGGNSTTAAQQIATAVSQSIGNSAASSGNNAAQSGGGSATNGSGNTSSSGGNTSSSGSGGSTPSAGASSGNGISNAPSPSNSSEGSGVSSPGGTTNTPAAVKTGLGDKVDQLAAKSPTLESNLQDLIDNNWTIQYGANGAGSWADREKTLIVIDGNFANNEVAAVQALSHEVGHAEYGFKADWSSKSAYVNGCLADEGAATIKNAEVRLEIMANGGLDIGLSGIHSTEYNSIYSALEFTHDPVAARQKIGTIIGSTEKTSNTGELYNDYYGNFYDQNPDQHTSSK